MPPLVRPVLCSKVSFGYTPQVHCSAGNQFAVTSLGTTTCPDWLSLGHSVPIPLGSLPIGYGNQ